MTDAAILELRAELAALRVRVERLEQQRREPRRLTDTALIVAIAATVQGRVFSAAELVVHARINPDLRDAIDGMAARRIGKRLRALAGKPRGGLAIQRIGRDSAGSLWVVQVCEDLHEGSGVGPGADV